MYSFFSLDAQMGEILGRQRGLMDFTQSGMVSLTCHLPQPLHLSRASLFSLLHLPGKIFAMAGIAHNEPTDGLCDSCSVLRLPDKRFGGFEGVNGVLAFPNEDEGLDLEYNRHDTLPFLPELKASAEAGCPFCGALRAATLSLGLDSYMEIVFRLFYSWKDPKFEPYGLCPLLLHINSVEDSPENTASGIGPPGVTMDGNAKLKRSLMFLVDAEDGKHLAFE